MPSQNADEQGRIGSLRRGAAKKRLCDFVDPQVAWGDNGAGQTNVPTGLIGVVAIAGGGWHSLALTSDGRVVGWGSNASGQTNVPAGLTNAVAIAGGRYHSLALVGDGSPSITVQPGSQRAFTGAKVTFQVMAASSSPPSYQWTFNGTNIPGATGSLMVLSAVQLVDAGNYQVVVSNALGVVTSRVAHLDVIPPPTIQFSASSYTVSEAAGTVTLAVQRLNDATTVVSVDYATADGTATNGMKYTATNGTLTFAAGETNKLIIVPILNEGFVEGTKYFRVILSNPTGGAVLGARATALVVIMDNDTGL